MRNTHIRSIIRAVGTVVTGVLISLNAMSLDGGAAANPPGNIQATSTTQAQAIESAAGSADPASTVHSVKLSWSPSVPATKSKRDAVKGYRIYRSTTTPVEIALKNRIDCAFIATTKCIDKNVAPGLTYHYVATAVSGGPGRETESAASTATSVTIPNP